MSALNFYNLKNSEKEAIYESLAERIGLSPFAVEKDWWVVQTLRLLFQTEIAPHLIFKGGTSLSKAWRVIERFSEDVDLALNREFLGFGGDISRTQVGKLRDASCKYISESLYPALRQSFSTSGLSDVDIRLGELKTTDQDPLTIEIHYPYIIAPSEYVKHQVLVEIGGRSMRIPFTNRLIKSYVGEYYADSPVEDAAIEIPTVNPERTLLEKLFLLHEEFQRPPEKRRVKRLSRHLYDIEQLSRTEYFQKALENHDLYRAIVAHRERFSKLGGVDYSSHFPPQLNPIPPEDLLADWERDYSAMQQQMIYGESLPFDQLIDSIQKTTDQINRLVFE